MQKEKEEKEKRHVSYYFRFVEFQQKFDDSIIASFERSIKTINKKLNKTYYRNSKKPKKYNICNDMFKHFEKLLILVAITIL